MGVISTKELFDEYFAQVDEVKAKKNRGHVEKKEVYEFEKKLGKELIDMDADELMEMVKTFRSGSVDADGIGIAYTSYKQISTLYRDIFNYYIQNYEIIINPWYDKKLKGKAAFEKLAEGTDALTFDKLQEIIDLVYNDYDSDYYLPKYVECIILLFYSGFATSKEIVSMKRDMVDLKTKTVTLPNKTIHLTDRCFELLEYFWNVDDVGGFKGIYYAVSYHDSYIKFFVRESRVKEFQDRPEEEVCAIVVRSMTKVVKQKLNININYRAIYKLGFYDFMCKKLGKEKVAEVVNSVRSPEDTAILMECAKEYGVKGTNPAIIKGDLLQYIQ